MSRKPRLTQLTQSQLGGEALQHFYLQHRLLKDGKEFGRVKVAQPCNFDLTPCSKPLSISILPFYYKSTRDLPGKAKVVTFLLARQFFRQAAANVISFTKPSNPQPLLQSQI